MPSITLPIVKSSNDTITRIPVNHYYDGVSVQTVWLEAPATSNMLYCAGPSNNRKKMALAWDSSAIPKNKIITNVKLYIFTANSHSKAIYYRIASFNEGSAIPSYEPTNGTITGGAAYGWKVMDLGVPDGESVIIGADLHTEQIWLGSPVNGYFTNVQYWSVYSHRSATNAPYVVVTYQDKPPLDPQSLYPSGIQISTRDIIRFAWLHGSEDNLGQKAFTLQYSLNSGTSWTTITQNTSNQFYDMPANTLPTSGTVTWRIKTKDTNDMESNYSTTTFTLGIPPQKAPIPVAPIGQYVERNKKVRFEWIFTGGSPVETQSKYDLQYSVNGGATWTTLTASTSVNYREVAENTFPTGNITWRVRTYNNYNEVSPYSENKAFTIIGSPPTPLITTVTNTARPVITWQSTEQHIYELQILKDNIILYDTGTVPDTTNKSFKVPIFSENGQYIARLRVANEYNLFSSWAEKAFTIATNKPNKPNLEIYNERYSIVINSDIAEGLVYRDYKLIGNLVNGKYTDYTGEKKKEHSYFIRNVVNDTFSDSNKMIGTCDFSGMTLALHKKSDDFIKIEVALNQNPKESGTYNVTYSSQLYDGRKLPIIEYGEFENRSKSVSFFVSSFEEVERIIEMIRKREKFLLRGERNITGSILSMSYDKNQFGYDISFILEEGEYSD